MLRGVKGLGELESTQLQCRGLSNIKLLKVLSTTGQTNIEICIFLSKTSQLVQDIEYNENDVYITIKN
jgi:hypothetical protein